MLPAKMQTALSKSRSGSVSVKNVATGCVRSSVSEVQKLTLGASALSRPVPRRAVSSNSRKVIVTRAVVSEAPAVVVVGASAGVIQLYRYPGVTESAAKTLLRKVQAKVTDAIVGIDGELCFNVGISAALEGAEPEQLAWLLRETYEPELLKASSHLTETPTSTVVEVGPRMTFSTAFSTNAVSICTSVGLSKVTRLEKSTRYLLKTTRPLTDDEKTAFAALVHDRMTDEVYNKAITSFAVTGIPESVLRIPVMTLGRKAIEEINDRMGFAFDEWDMDYYTKMFQDMGRDPTNVELFDIAQSNSEHSRHWFFGGSITIDGVKVPETLFSIVKEPWKANPNNSVVAFKDNSSCIRGFQIKPLLPASPGNPSPLMPQDRDYDLLLTAETHNFPCAVAPYPGAETGAGGRMRDTHATGTGSIMGAGTAGYCVGNLLMEGYEQPWENKDAVYPKTLASPLQILIDASNGASDYGNKFGEPLIAGYTRTYGERLPNGERREWLKPIMFSAGVGQIDHSHLVKGEGEIGHLVIKIGGPAYRIGMGGGAASSVPSGSSDDRAALDFNAVQRGDAEMSQKLWRVVRACVEMGEKNPIVQIHDQGAGGNCNVVKEVIYPLGAEIDVRKVKLGDETMSVLEIWGAEYQENDCILLKPDGLALLESICARERCLMSVLGTIDGSGRVRLIDSLDKDALPAVDLDLDSVLGKLPAKSYDFVRRDSDELIPVELPSDATPVSALNRVLRLTSVGSKRFLTTKVDRHVTGLVAQQQCVGPLHIPLSDYAVTAQSHQNLSGLATSIGEAPIKGLINPKAMARLALGEALTNLVFAKATSLPDVRASVNWMHAAKLGNEGAAMYDAAKAMSACMIDLGVACDGGKDSLSMAAKAGNEVVMAPGNLVVSAYVGMPDITKKITPDLKLAGTGVLLHVDLAEGRRRIGGSCLGQVYNQLGDESPDVTSAQLKGMWEVTQDLIQKGELSSGHDISDGGLVTSVLEMAFAGNVGITADIPMPTNAKDAKHGAFASLFAEELGLVLEVEASKAEMVIAAYTAAGVSCSAIGKVTTDGLASISVAGKPEVTGTTAALRDLWEETSFKLEYLQAAEECVAQEQAGLKTAKAPMWKLTYTPEFTSAEKLAATDKVRVAVIREEGSNGDREMSAAVFAAGMEPWDITMSDLLAGRANLDSFRGIIFVGGFSYADTLDSAKGWSGAIRFNEKVTKMFQEFYTRTDTFSLGICNGCQLMALLGWVPSDGVEGVTESPKPLADQKQPRFIHNASGRFESRYVQVQIDASSPAIMLKGMGGSTMGVWAAHGEGKCLFPSEEVKSAVLSKSLAPIRYVDADGNQTEAYPANPNGSPLGIASLCSTNGRHMSMMPHPERCFLGWQMPWVPTDLGIDPYGAGPWLKLFQNARVWCEENPSA